MAWLRSKRKTIDLGAENSDMTCAVKQTCMDNGEYRYQPTQKNPTTDNNDSNSNNNNTTTNNKILDNNFMNGIISTSPCVIDTNKSKFFESEAVSEEFISLYDNNVNNNVDVNDDDDNNGDDDKTDVNIVHNDNNLEENGEEYNIPADRDENEDAVHTNNSRKLSNISIDDSDSTLASLSPTHDHSVDDNINLSFPDLDSENEDHRHINNINNNNTDNSNDDDDNHKDDNRREKHKEHDEEGRDSFAEYTSTYRNKQNFNKPRHSLDSQIALLPAQLKSSLKVNSFDSLDESEEEDYYGEVKPISKKKSISWASELETIHEFEKIKGRRLSLSSFFKKL